MTRIMLQNTDVWFDDDVDEAVREKTSKDGHGELLPVRVTKFTFLSSALYIPSFNNVSRCSAEILSRILLHMLIHYFFCIY